MLKIVFKTCKNETLMTSYSHFTKFFSRKILKYFTQDRSTNMYSTYVERSQPGLMYRQKPTEYASTELCRRLVCSNVTIVNKKDTMAYEYGIL